MSILEASNYHANDVCCVPIVSNFQQSSYAQRTDSTLRTHHEPCSATTAHHDQISGCVFFFLSSLRNLFLRGRHISDWRRASGSPSNERSDGEATRRFAHSGKALSGKKSVRTAGLTPRFFVRWSLCGLALSPLQRASTWERYFSL